MSCSPASIVSGSSTTCTVTLTSAAPSGGTSVTLSSNNSALTVPASVTVPATTTSTTFSGAGSTPTTQTATITASANGASRTTTVTVTPSTGPAVVSSVGYINTTALTAHTTAAFNSGGASTLVALVSSHPTWNGLPISISGLTDNAGNTGGFTPSAHWADQEIIQRGTSIDATPSALYGGKAFSNTWLAVS